ncbi:MAG TPA: citrate synthase [Azospirillaceae bacterium]|nr:citrate synthase [Azospirillaceae bacterium]
MSGVPTVANSGLDGVIAAETVLSHVDGERGLLIVCGERIEDLAGRIGFEELAAALWTAAGTPTTVAAARPAIGEARAAAARLVPALLPAVAGLTPVEGLRLMLAALPDAAPMPPHILAVGAIPVFIAAQARAARGLEALTPDPGAGHAADFLRLLAGTPPSAAAARALDAYLVTVADHGLNASTFTARVVASTRAGTPSAIVAALCALKGPLHGGAPGPVLDMLDEIGTPERIEGWIEARLAAGERLMGFGHRIYRVRDPRADVLKRAVTELRVAGTDAESTHRLSFAEQVEHAAHAALARHRPGRRLDTNVEFYTALLLEALGLPRALFTPVFAMGRAAGWTAHVMEQVGTGRIIRPDSRYIGAWPRNAEAA